jgi:hypothetical protein
MTTEPVEDPRRIAVEDLRPTQLYLSAAKLASVLDEFEEHDPYGPLPAFEHEGEWYLSDGHTRAFAAYLGGAETIPIERDREVREVYDFDLYLTCIDWCREEDVRAVPDLGGRILAHETFEEEWIERCHRAAEDEDEDGDENEDQE